MKDPQPKKSHEAVSVVGNYYADIAEKIQDAKTPGEAFAAALIAQAEARVGTIPEGLDISNENDLRHLSLSQQRAITALDTLKNSFRDKKDATVSALEVFANKVADRINQRPGSVPFDYPITNDRLFHHAVKWVYLKGNNTLPKIGDAHMQGAPTYLLPLARALRDTHDSVIPVDTAPSDETNQQLYGAVLRLLPNDNSAWHTEANLLTINRQTVWEKPDDNAQV